jgi:hypothetical protein
MVVRSEADSEIAVAEHRTDALAVAGIVFDDRASCGTVVVTAPIVVIRDAPALERARQSFGGPITGRAGDRLGSVDVEKAAERVGLH